jgi:hypothetical protein
MTPQTSVGRHFTAKAMQTSKVITSRRITVDMTKRRRQPETQPQRISKFRVLERCARPRGRLKEGRGERRARRLLAQPGDIIPFIGRGWRPRLLG